MSEEKINICIDASRPSVKDGRDEFTVSAYDRTSGEDVASIPLRKLIAETCGECADYPDARAAYQLAEILSLGAAMARLAASKAEMFESGAVKSE